MQPQTLKNISFAFKILYAIILFIIVLSGYIIFNKNYNLEFMYNMGKILGLTALLFFILTLIPGILTRFGFRSTTINILRVLRTDFGKSMFLFGVAHYLIIKTFPTISMGSQPSFLPFEIFGFFAITLTIPLFITSNKFSQSKLGKWWKRIHALVYIIVWLVFLHVALAKIAPVTFLIGALAIAELVSLIFSFVVKRNKAKIAV